MRPKRRLQLGLFASLIAPCAWMGCANTSTQKPSTASADYSAIRTGCESIRLYEPHHTVDFRYRTLQTLEGTFADRSKDLRAWLINEACALGATAVMSVSETMDSDEQGLPVYKIRGTAVTFDRGTMKLESVATP